MRSSWGEKFGLESVRHLYAYLPRVPHLYLNSSNFPKRQTLFLENLRGANCIVTPRRWDSDSRLVPLTKGHRGPTEPV